MWDSNPGQTRSSLQALEEIATAVTAGASARSLAETSIDALESRIGYENGAVLLLDPPDRLVPLALSSRGGGRDARDRDMDYVRRQAPPMGKGVTGWVAQVGRSARIDDVRSDRRYVALRDNLRSELCVPLKFGDAVFGVLNVESRRASAYDEADQRLLETVAAQLTLSVRSDFAQLGLTDGILPICSHCRKVRTDEGHWITIEEFLDRRLGLGTSHGICPGCMTEHWSGA